MLEPTPDEGEDSWGEVVPCCVLTDSAFTACESSSPICAPITLEALEGRDELAPKPCASLAGVDERACCMN